LIKQVFQSRLLDMRCLWVTISIIFYPGARLSDDDVDAEDDAQSNMNLYLPCTSEVCDCIDLFGTPILNVLRLNMQ